ncbi:Structural maintenance of chromosomes protein 2, partial [Perkinsus chesapeaki]
MQATLRSRATRSSTRLRKMGKDAHSDSSPDSLFSPSPASPGQGSAGDAEVFDTCVAEAAREAERSGPSSTPPAKRVRLDGAESVTRTASKSAPAARRARESTSTMATTPGLRIDGPRDADLRADDNNAGVANDVICDGPMLLDRLRAPEKDGGAGLTTADIQKLMDQGIGTVEALAFTPIRHINNLRGISDQKAERLKKAAVTLVPMGFQSAGQYLEQRSSMIRISTGCKAIDYGFSVFGRSYVSPSIDTLLCGGIETGSITEIFGESRAGKSQFCHALCVAAQLPICQGGAAGRSMYIDTEGTFRPERLMDMGQKWGL